MTKYINLFKIAFIYSISVIGAGFVSGQEILKFFTKYNEKSIFAILLACLFLGLSGALILEKVRTNNTKKFIEYLELLMPKKLAIFFNEAITIFLLSAFYVVIAGVSSEINTYTKINKGAVAFLISVICILLAQKGIKAIMNINYVLSPFLIFGIVVTGGWLAISNSFSKEVFSGIDGLINKTTNNWVYSAVIYASYNILLSSVLLCSMGQFLRSKRDALVGGFLGGIILMVPIFIVNNALLTFYNEIYFVEFPFVELVKIQGNIIISFLYEIMFILILMISALTNAFCFLQRFEKNITYKNKPYLVIIMALISIPAAYKGFSGLISIIYPVFGVVGIILLMFICYDVLKVVLFKDEKNS